MRRHSARAAAPRLRVRRPADFLALVPYLLGFHPTESVVAIYCQGGRVLLTARVDLPPPALAAALAEQVADLAARHGAEEVVLVGYGSDGPDTRAVLQRLLEGGGPRVREAVLVSEGRWWSLTCTDGCCPAEGTAHDPAAHPLAAEAVYAGLSAQPSRTELQRQVRGPDDAEEDALAELVARVSVRTAPLDRSESAALMALTVRRCCEDPGPPGDEDCLLLALLATDLVVRDVAWALVEREDVEDHLRVWQQVVTRTPAALAPGPLGLLGVTGWIAGQGALQNCCSERLTSLDPDYTLGLLLADISDRALPPRCWDGMAEGLREEVSAVAGLPGLH